MKSIVERVGKVSQMLGEISSGAAVPSDGIGRVGALSQSLKTPQQMRISGKRVNVSHACGVCVEQQWNNKASAVCRKCTSRLVPASVMSDQFGA